MPLGAGRERGRRSATVLTDAGLRVGGVLSSRVRYVGFGTGERQLPLLIAFPDEGTRTTSARALPAVAA